MSNGSSPQYRQQRQLPKDRRKFTLGIQPRLRSCLRLRGLGDAGPGDFVPVSGAGAAF